jgi:hypothetical protein
MVVPVSASAGDELLELAQRREQQTAAAALNDATRRAGTRLSMFACR